MKYTKRHIFGQHFLVDESTLSYIVDLAEIDNGAKVLEVGTGKGDLTKYIARKAAYVKTVELDKILYIEAKTRLSSYKNVECIQGNILYMDDLGADIIISNLPYSISGRFIEWLSGQGCCRAVIVLQQDFVDKLTQGPGMKKYGPVSVLSQFCFRITKGGSVPRESFRPHPKVSSCIVKFERRVSLLGWKYISSRLKFLFSFRGKMISSALKKIRLVYSDLIDGLQQDKRRVEELTPEELIQLASKME